MLDPDQIRQLRTSGFVHLRGVVPSSRVADAQRAIDADLAANYDPARYLEYEHRTYCPELRGDARILALLAGSPARAVVDAVLPYRRLWGPRYPQIALRQAHNHSAQVPVEWHIDGVPTALNGVRGQSLATFTALVGIFLSTTPGEFSGNFTVWPSSFARLRDFFAARGRRGLREGQPDIDPGEPRQLLTEPGDVVLCHYLVAHGAAVNTSPVERRAVFFRLALPNLVGRRWRHLVEPWRGWRPVQAPSPGEVQRDSRGASLQERP